MRFSPGLQGLRGVAILLVVACHTGLLPGGWIGVDVFFVLSGFLITRLLMERPSLRGFYARRVRRLGPALAVLIPAAVLIEAVVFRRILPLSTVLGGVTYSMNFLRFHGGHDPLGHLWSLAQEEQFYLVWPLLLYGVRPAWRVRLTVVLALLSVAWLVSLSGHVDIDRVYYGPDTHALPLLAGCLVALVEWRPSVRTARVLGVIGAAMLAVVSNCDTPYDFEWMVVFGAFGGVGVVFAALTDPRLLCGSVLQRLGLYSYGIYLWHYPLLVWLPHDLAVPLTLVIAAASFHLVEVPIRHRLRPAFA